MINEMCIDNTYQKVPTHPINAQKHLWSWNGVTRCEVSNEPTGTGARNGYFVPVDAELEPITRFLALRLEHGLRDEGKDI